MKSVIYKISALLAVLSFALVGCSDNDEPEKEFVIGTHGVASLLYMDFVDEEGNSLLDGLKFDASGLPQAGDVVVSQFQSNQQVTQNTIVETDANGRRWLWFDMSGGFGRFIPQSTKLIKSAKIFGDDSQHEIKSYWKKQKGTPYTLCTKVEVDGKECKGEYRDLQFNDTMTVKNIYHVVVTVK